MGRDRPSSQTRNRCFWCVVQVQAIGITVTNIFSSKAMRPMLPYLKFSILSVKKVKLIFINPRVSDNYLFVRVPILFAAISSIKSETECCL